MDDYGQPLLIDLATVLLCIGLLVRFGDLHFSHPATPYIVFHLHTVTARLAGLVNGAPTLYATWHAFDAVVPEEIARAALYCDIAFFSVTVVWVFVKAAPEGAEMLRSNVVRLDQRILRPALFIAFVGGTVGLRLAARIPGIESFEGLSPTSEWSTSSYLVILPTWFGLAVLGHMYYYGTRWFTGGLLVLYLVLMAFQGFFRFRVIVAILLAVTIWVERRNRRWPSKSIVLGLGAAAVLFFPMKTIGTLAQQGASMSQISDAVSESVTEASGGAAADHLFLDEFACALTLLDQQGKLYLGSIYLPLLTLPIPRAIWPDKPALGAAVREMSTRSRPMAASGMTTTYLGESYANFGLVGILLVPPLLAVFLARFRRWAYVRPYDSLARFSYVLLSVNLIQVYRDGLLSIVMFTFVNMMPLVIIVIAHALLAVSRRRQRVVLSSGGPPDFYPDPRVPERKRAFTSDA